MNLEERLLGLRRITGSTIWVSLGSHSNHRVYLRSNTGFEVQLDDSGGTYIAQCHRLKDSDTRCTSTDQDLLKVLDVIEEFITSNH